MYVVAKVGRLSFYKDQKATKAVPEATFRGEIPLLLEGASVDVATDYTKKKHVFRIKYEFFFVHFFRFVFTILYFCFVFLFKGIEWR